MKNRIVLLFILPLFLVGCGFLKMELKGDVYKSNRYAFSTYLYFHNDSLFTITEGFVINHGKYLVKEDSLYLYVEENNLDSFYCGFNILPVENNIIPIRIVSAKKLLWKRFTNGIEKNLFFEEIDTSKLRELEKIKCNGFELIK